jgi:hypothetical protein
MERILLALTLIGCSAPALSQTMTPGTITMIRTGWNSDSFAIVTAEPIANPANCPNPDGYVSINTLPGYSTYYAAALTAYALNQPVVITTHDTECAATRPKLIGVNLGR